MSRLRTLELLILFIGIPLLMLEFTPVRGLFAYLCLCAIFCTYILMRDTSFERRELWHFERVTWVELQPMLIRFFSFVILSTIAVHYLLPHKLFELPLQRPSLWILIMLLYPILSVYPQEIIFRSFFIHRYQKLFPNVLMMRLANGFCFGFAHIFMLHWLAPVLCAMGGVMFAATYQKTRSLALVSIEHALYGCWIFTVGLGTFFYSGAVR